MCFITDINVHNFFLKVPLFHNISVADSEKNQWLHQRRPTTKHEIRADGESVASHCVC